MMTHLEGPIVDAFYDMSLITWHNALKPPLPSHATPAADCCSFRFVEGNGTSEPQESLVHGETVPDKEPLQSAYGHPLGEKRERVDALDDGFVHRDDATTGLQLDQQNSQQKVARETHAPEEVPSGPDRLPAHTSSEPHYDVDIAGEVLRAQSALRPGPGRDGHAGGDAALEFVL